MKFSSMTSAELLAFADQVIDEPMATARRLLPDYPQIERLIYTNKLAAWARAMAYYHHNGDIELADQARAIRLSLPETIQKMIY